MSTTRSIKPTESELEILQILWTKGLATVREVHEGLAATKGCWIYHYTQADADHE